MFKLTFEVQSPCVFVPLGAKPPFRIQSAPPQKKKKLGLGKKNDGTLCRAHLNDFTFLNDSDS